MTEATPSPSSGTSRVATPPVTTTPDVIVPSCSTGVPSPAGSDTTSGADIGPTPLKRPRLRSTKSELFIVNSELSRDSDASCNASASHAVGQTVASLVSDDSLDSSSVADTSQNSVAAASVDSQIDTDHASSTDIQSTVVPVCKTS